MSWWLSLLLGITQGITEFLPVSSSGHLAIFQRVFSNYINPEDWERLLQFDILLHVGTLIAVFVYFRKDIADLINAFFSMFSASGRGNERTIPARRLFLLILVSTLPLLIAVFFKSQVEVLMHNLIFVGCALIGTGTLLYIADRIKLGKKNEKTARVSDAAVVGIMQTIAIIPGLSRSGSTISAGLMRGFDRQFAIRFSFLMSIPAILGATLLELIKAFSNGAVLSDFIVFLPGMFASAIVGYASIVFVKRMAIRGKFGAFAYYCVFAGLLAIIFNFVF